MKCYCNFFRCGNEVWIEGKKILNFVSFVSENTVMKLAETAEMVKKEKIAGYQENIWSVYLEDMLSISEIF